MYAISAPASASLPSALLTSRYGFSRRRCRLFLTAHPTPRSAANSALCEASTPTLSDSASRIFWCAFRTAAVDAVCPTARPALFASGSFSFSGMISVSKWRRPLILPASPSYSFCRRIWVRDGSLSFVSSSFLSAFSTRSCAFSYCLIRRGFAALFSGSGFPSFGASALARSSGGISLFS